MRINAVDRSNCQPRVVSAPVHTSIGTDANDVPGPSASRLLPALALAQKLPGLDAERSGDASEHFERHVLPGLEPGVVGGRDAHRDRDRGLRHSFLRADFSNSAGDEQHEGVEVGGHGDGTDPAPGETAILGFGYPYADTHKVSRETPQASEAGRQVTRGELLALLSSARYATLRAYRDLREISEALEADDVPRAKRAAAELEESADGAITELDAIDRVLSEKTRLRK